MYFHDIKLHFFTSSPTENIVTVYNGKTHEDFSVLPVTLTLFLRCASGVVYINLRIRCADLSKSRQL
jgi:hypothetical protein